MARIRSIKPEFWTSEQVVACSSNARLLFIGIWTFSDDNGIHPDKPAQLKMKVFPGDMFTFQDIAAMVDELEENGLVKRYEVDGEAYIQVTGWGKHQRIDQPSFKYPTPSGDVPPTPNRRRTEASKDKGSEAVRRTPAKRSSNASPRSGVEGSGNGKETNSASAGLFDEFWNAYPKKQSKQEALRAWNKLSPDEPLSNQIIEHVKTRAATDPQWLKDGGQFVPNGSTFLNQRRWEDQHDRVTAHGYHGVVQFPGSPAPRRPLLPKVGAS